MMGAFEVSGVGVSTAMAETMVMMGAFEVSGVGVSVSLAETVGTGSLDSICCLFSAATSE